MIRGYKENTIAGADNYFSSMDIHFGHFIASFGKENKKDLFLAAALVSRSVRDGHICLDLNSLAGRIIFKSDDGKTAIECPPLNSWIAALKSAPCVGCPGDFKPFQGVFLVNPVWPTLCEIQNMNIFDNMDLLQQLTGLRAFHFPL